MSRRLGHRAIVRYGLGFGLIAVLLGLWQLASARQWVNENYFPRPSQVLAEATEAETSTAVLDGLASTFGRYTIAFLTAAAAGIVVGLLMGYFDLVHATLEPLFEAIRPIPTPAYIPLAILVLGIGDEMKIAVSFVAGFFPILINTVAGVRSVNPALRETSRLLNFSSFEELRRIVAPASLPGILTGLRISLGVVLLVSVVAEMIATGGSGIGYFIIDMQRAFQTEAMYVGIVVVGIVGYLLNKLFVTFESYALARWAGVQERST